MQQVETIEQVRQSLSWIGQAVSGILLIVIVVLHMILHHFQAQGLLSANQAIAQTSNITYLILEIAFVIIVTYHALVGIKSAIFNLNLSEETRRKISAVITVIGILTIIYGTVIAFLIRSQAASF